LIIGVVGLAFPFHLLSWHQMLCEELALSVPMSDMFNNTSPVSYQRRQRMMSASPDSTVDPFQRSHSGNSAPMFRVNKLLALQQEIEDDARQLKSTQQYLSTIFRIPQNASTSASSCLEPQNSNNSSNSNLDSLMRLHDLGIPVCWLDSAIRNRILPWSTIAKNYGDTPRIIGLDQCQALQQAIPKLEDRWLAVAGLFHSGTNLLFTLLSHHCNMRPSLPTTTPALSSSSTYRGIAWQVSWGKHQPAYVRDTLYRVTSKLSPSQQLPVVMIRHPYTWMESMCQESYKVSFLTFKGGSCPDRFTHYVGTKRSIPVKVLYGYGVKYYESVAHLYDRWYRDYLYSATTTATTNSSSFPRLMVRLEDLIHHPKRVVQKVCECAGGIFHWNTTMATSTTITSPSDKNIPSNLLSSSSLTLLLGNVKEGKHGHNSSSHSTGFLQAWMGSNVTSLISNSIKDYARQVLDDNMMKLFHYQL
jgi:hypothetical protein